MIDGEKARDIYIKQTDILNLLRSSVQPGAYRDQFIELIRCIPAYDVEPKKKWIPVTERLPKTNEKVLVYVFDPDFCGPYIEFGHWLNWLKRWGEFDDEVGDFGDCTIIAWMPLPDPPEGGKQQYD